LAAAAVNQLMLLFSIEIAKMRNVERILNLLYFPKMQD